VDETFRVLVPFTIIMSGSCERNSSVITALTVECFHDIMAAMLMSHTNPIGVDLFT